MVHGSLHGGARSALKTQADMAARIASRIETDMHVPYAGGGWRIVAHMGATLDTCILLAMDVRE